MKTLPATILCCVCAFGCTQTEIPSADSDPDGSTEPPLVFDVRVGETVVSVKDGESAQATGSFTNPVVSVTPRSTREFTYGGIHLSYPSYFTFEADVTNPASKEWTLSGNDFTIMYFVYEDSMSVKDLTDGFMLSFDAADCKIANPVASIRLGDCKLQGQTLHVTIATNQLTYGIFQIPSTDNKSRLLVFMDSPDIPDHQSDEARKTIDRLKASFKLAPAGA